MDKDVHLGQKLTASTIHNDSTIKVIEIEEKYNKISKNHGASGYDYLADLKRALERVNENDLNSFYKQKFLDIKKNIDRKEYINKHIRELHTALLKLQFSKAYRIAKILYAQTEDKSYLYKIKDKKLHVYNRIAEKYFINKNYIGSKNLYSLSFTLTPSERVKERLQTIGNIFRLSKAPQVVKKNVVLTNLSDRIVNLEKQYKFLHAYYLIKKHINVVVGKQREDLRAIGNTISRKWQEVRKIAKDFLKDAFILSKNDSRLDLEKALKKVELAKKYFPYFYKYDKMIDELKSKIEFSGMVLVPEGIVTYIHPVTKNVITTKVASFYIDKEYLTFDEYLHYLAENRKEELEALKKQLISHKFRGDISKRAVELISFNDVKRFARYVGKKLPTIEQLIRFCDIFRSKGPPPRLYSVFSANSANTVGNEVIAVMNNYLTKKPDINCSSFYKVPKNRGFVGISVKLVKNIQPSSQK